MSKSRAVRRMILEEREGETHSTASQHLFVPSNLNASRPAPSQALFHTPLAAVPRNRLLQGQAFPQSDQIRSSRAGNSVGKESEVSLFGEGEKSELDEFVRVRARSSEMTEGRYLRGGRGL